MTEMTETNKSSEEKSNNTPVKRIIKLEKLVAELTRKVEILEKILSRR